MNWTPVALDKWAKPVILLLYAGKDDAGSLDACLHAHHAWISPFIRAIDTRRDPGPMGQDMLAPEPYNTLCTMAARGLIPIVTGGPNCRTWSILRWFPKPGAPKPVRGRSEEQVWGLPGLTPRDQEDVDDDSTLLLRQMYLTSLAYQGVASQTIPHCPGSFLEHPSDPKETSNQGIPTLGKDLETPAGQVRPVSTRTTGSQVHHPVNRLGPGPLDWHDL